MALVKSAEIIFDGKLVVVFFDDTSTYLQPPILVHTFQDDEIIRLIGVPNKNVQVDITIEVIDGVAFAGNFDDLDIAIREAIEKCNNIYNKAIAQTMRIIGSVLPTGAATQTTLAAIETAINSLAKLTESQPILNKNDFHSDVSRGLITGVMNFKKQGFNSAVSTTQRMLNSAGTPIVPLTVAATISFVSTSASDASAGTGARTLLITGVDASGNYQTEILALDGTTPVVTANTWLGVLNRVQVLTAGSGETNAGVITGTSGGNTYSTIQVGISASRQLCFYVPNGKTALIHSYLFDVSKNLGASVVLNIYFYTLIAGVRTEIYPWKLDAATGSPNIINRSFESPIPIPQNSIWWVEASTTSGTGWLDGEIEQVIFDN